MFDKIFTSIGIGAATVDTKLSQAEYKQTDIINGVVEVRGGTSNQFIARITVKFISRLHEYREDSDFDTHDKVLLEEVVLEKEDIKANTTHKFPFDLNIDGIEFPSTDDTTKLFILTEVEIGQSVDAFDEDEVKIIS